MTKRDIEIECVCVRVILYVLKYWFYRVYIYRGNVVFSFKICVEVDRDSKRDRQIR